MAKRKNSLSAKPSMKHPHKTAKRLAIKKEMLEKKHGKKKA